MALSALIVKFPDPSQDWPGPVGWRRPDRAMVEEARRPDGTRRVVEIGVGMSGRLINMYTERRLCWWEGDRGLAWRVAPWSKLGGEIVEAADPADTLTSNELFLLYAWLPLIFGIPYVILGLVGGFGTTFRSGDASTFICGALVGAVGENIIGRAESRSSRFRTLGSSTRTDSRTGELITPQAITVLIFALGLLAWNMYFAFQAKTVDYPPIDWVQIVAFAVAATQLTSLRFFLSEYYHDVMLPRMKVMIAEGDIPIPTPLLGWVLWLTREHKASSKANVNDQSESDGRSGLLPP